MLGLTPFVYEPIRAAHLPAINEGEPTGVHDRASSVELHVLARPRTTRLMDNINREQYGKPELSERQAPFSAQVGMWWLYFKWQWLRDAHGEQPALQSVLAVAVPRARRRSAATCTGNTTARHSGTSGR